MPLHLLYCSPTLYTAEDKQNLSLAITKLYAMLPDFYVVVNFVPIEDQYVGGVKRDNFLRTVVHHLAVTTPDTAEGNVKKTAFMDHYSATLKPFTLDRGISWEAEVIQSDPVFWRMDGIQPPTTLEKERLQAWRDAGTPLPRL
ncbi:hypothetical protein RQP46_001983 [Phenoliferia psychrophenolica]